MADLLGKARRKVTVRLADPDGLKNLRELPVVEDLQIEGDHAHFHGCGRHRPSRCADADRQ
jgi:hypothetical protein